MSRQGCYEGFARAILGSSRGFAMMLREILGSSPGIAMMLIMKFERLVRLGLFKAFPKPEP